MKILTLSSKKFYENNKICLMWSFMHDSTKKRIKMNSYVEFNRDWFFDAFLISNDNTLFVIYYLCNVISLYKIILYTKGLFKYLVVYNMKAIKFYLLQIFLIIFVRTINFKWKYAKSKKLLNKIDIPWY